MANYFDKPDHWRMRAEMTRTIALGMQGRGKDILLGIANDYDKMATRMEHEARVARREAPPQVPPPVAKPDLQDRIVELKHKWNGR